LTPNSVYRQNASLANTMQTGNANYAANNVAQAAMWENINSANNTPSNNYANKGANGSTVAVVNGLSFNSTDWFVVTAPPGAGQQLGANSIAEGTQELLAHVGSITTPEPSIYALLVPSLLVVAAGPRWSRKHRIDRLTSITAAPDQALSRPCARCVVTVLHLRTSRHTAS